MGKGKIFIISGPSGSGKTTLHKKLLASRQLKGNLVKSISATTRSPRNEEKDGRDYLFLTHPEFLSKIDEGYFLEWQKVFNNYYGTPEPNVRELLAAGKNVLLCIDVKGARVISKKIPEAVKIFINVPSLDVLKERLSRRGTENNQDLELRLETARQEIKEAKRYNHMIVNDDLAHSYRKLLAVVLNELKPKEEESLKKSFSRSAKRVKLTKN